MLKAVLKKSREGGKGGKKEAGLCARMSPAMDRGQQAAPHPRLDGFVALAVGQRGLPELEQNSVLEAMRNEMGQTWWPTAVILAF